MCMKFFTPFSHILQLPFVPKGTRGDKLADHIQTLKEVSELPSAELQKLIHPLIELLQRVEEVRCVLYFNS